MAEAVPFQSAKGRVFDSHVRERDGYESSARVSIR